LQHGFNPLREVTPCTRKDAAAKTTSSSERLRNFEVRGYPNRNDLDSCPLDDEAAFCYSLAANPTSLLRTICSCITACDLRNRQSLQHSSSACCCCILQTVRNL
jgi:hypothetical protein